MAQMIIVILLGAIVRCITNNAANSSSLLCGRTKEVEVGGNVGAGAALALTLLRPPSSTSNSPCQLRLTAPDATAFTVRLIDVKKLKPKNAKPVATNAQPENYLSPVESNVVN
ncbi:unnamed protein product [Euphydryas editha]|uniref:Uncharacterized protein n=1 Tax=Euphydryas editha TaxID=104508 RepID=A0AAU9UNV2_EUPED|nr:unnamed protein product [Euphydryas editha]